jgi:hypothetical protein
MARGHHCGLARAFAVNPSRLPARPSGLRGLTVINIFSSSLLVSRGSRERGSADGMAVPLLGRAEREKPLDSRRLI